MSAAISLAMEVPLAKAMLGKNVIVKGEIRSQEDYIRKNAKFVGNILSAGIIIEDGGYIKGNIELSRQPADSQNRRKDRPFPDGLADATDDAWSPTSKRVSGGLPPV